MADDEEILNTEQYFGRLLEPKYNPRNTQEYLVAMNTYLVDSAFKEKVSDLPKVTSSSITKLEKNVLEEIELKKEMEVKKSQRTKSLNIPTNRMSRLTFKVKSTSTGLKNLIFDPAKRDLNYNTVDENYEIINKLTNPYKVFLQETDNKVRNQAVKEIIANVTLQDDKHKILPMIVDKRKPIFPSYDDKYYTVPNSYPSLGIMPTEGTSEGVGAFCQSVNGNGNGGGIMNTTMFNSTSKLNDEEIKKIFNRLCKQNNIVSFNQKMDFFVENYQKFQKTLNDKEIPGKTIRFGKSKNMSVDLTKLFGSQLSTNNNLNNPITQIMNNREVLITTPSSIQGRKTKSNSSRRVTFQGSSYISELKLRYTVNEEYKSNDIALLLQEAYIKELKQRLSDSKPPKYNKHSSFYNYIEVIKRVKNMCEISAEFMMLKDVGLTPDRTIYLLDIQPINFLLLKHIDISRNTLSDTGVNYFMHLICIHSRSLEYLNISHNHITVANTHLVEYLKSYLIDDHNGLKGLNISANDFQDKNIAELAIGLSKNKTLKKFWCAKTGITDFCGVIFGTMLKYDNKLELLDLSENKLGPDSVSAIFKGIIINNHLNFLFLCRCGLTNKVVRSLVTTLKLNPALKELFLDWNHFNDEACDQFIDILNDSKLTTISLLGTNMSQKGVLGMLEMARVEVKTMKKTEYFQNLLKVNGNYTFLFEYF